MKMKIVVVYFDANKNGEGRERNKKLRSDIEKIMERNKMEGIIILGDFNGHLRMLDGKETDQNGKMILEWMEEYKLTLLNIEEKCEGIYTRVRGEQKTAIDYVLVNNRVHERFDSMHIDEEKLILDESDHTLVTVNLNMEDDRKQRTVEWKETTYYSLKEEELKAYADDLGNMWKDDKKSLQERVKDMIGKAEDRLKKKKKIKVGIGGKPIPVEKKWMTDEIRGGIKKRKELNRKKRYGKTREETETHK